MKNYMTSENKEKAKKFMSNMIVRNIILFISLVIILMFVAQILLGLFTRHGQHKSVPDFVGATIEDARKTARHHGGLRIEVSDSLYVPTYDGGIVLEQKPEAGAKVKAGRRIFVTVNSFTQKMVDVPYVTGFSLRQAKNNLENAGLEIERLDYVSDIATNYVLGEKVDGKELRRGSKVQAEVGSGVILTVGRGEDSHAIIPKVVGLSLREAKSRLWEQGLNVGKLTFDDDINAINQRSAKVYVQDPGQAHSVQLGSSVALKLTLDEEKVSQGVTDSDSSAKRINAQRFREEAEANANGNEE